MREGKHFKCSGCDAFDFGMTCILCGGVPLDENGNEVPKLTWAYPTTSLGRLALGVAALNRNLTMRRLFGAQTSSVVEREGRLWAKVRGRVHQLSGVSFSNAKEPRDELKDIACYAQSYAPFRFVTQECGRFLVDGERTAMVDEDFFRVWPMRGDYRIKRAVVRHGDTVEVFGPVVEKSIVELGIAPLGGGGYRGGGTVLLFEGTTKNKVYVRPVGASEES